MEWIRSVLVALRAVIQERQINSIAIPPLGCGLGGLDWAEVRPMIEAALGDLPGVDVWLYEPAAGGTMPPGMKQGKPEEGGRSMMNPRDTAVPELGSEHLGVHGAVIP